jgi:all-trans-retinol 13,14-reductase
VFTYAGVEQVLIENNRAYGVRLVKDGHQITADKVVSCAGLLPTYQRLLPAEVVERHGLLDKLEQVEPSASHVCLYAGFKGDAATLDIPKTNFWLYPEFDHDLSVKRFMGSPGLDFPMIYISFPSAKDPDWDRRYPGKSTVEIVAPSFPQWFERWKGSTWNKRGEDYEAFKARITEVLLEALYKHQPQLREALDYCELSTPLSTEWFQWNQVGEIYGIEHTVQRFEQHWIHPQTPIKDFYLTGSDVVTAGVGGALMGGVLTATRLLGWRAYKIKQLIDAAYRPETQERQLADSPS